MNSSSELKIVLRQMLAVMEEERQALAGLDLEAIIGCTNNKVALCDQLGSASNDNLDDECLSMIEAVKRLNDVNRQFRNLISVNVSSRLEALTGAPTTYGVNSVRSGYARISAFSGQ